MIVDELIDLKDKLGMSQREIADRLGVAESTISRVASGKQDSSEQLLYALRMLKQTMEYADPWPWMSPGEKERVEALALSIGVPTGEFLVECARRYGLQTARDLQQEIQMLNKAKSVKEDAPEEPTATRLVRKGKQK